VAAAQSTLDFERPRYRAARLALRRKCRHCLRSFTTYEGAKRYCSESCYRAAANNRKRKKSTWIGTVRQCRRCGADFTITESTGHNRSYCSPECSRLSMRRSREAFYGRNDGVQRVYNASRGRDSLIVRLYKRYPDLPRECEAVGCGEGRVIEAAHKPEHRRNGAARSMARYDRHMFWMLCPTHHELVDRGIVAPAELGLS
jgi:hypothetical protein